MVTHGLTEASFWLQDELTGSLVKLQSGPTSQAPSYANFQILFGGCIINRRHDLLQRSSYEHERAGESADIGAGHGVWETSEYP